MRLFSSFFFAAAIFFYVFCATNFHTVIAEENKFLFDMINKIVWIAFIVDYIVMLFLSRNKLHFFKSHLFHLIVVAVPFLRVLRIAMLVLMLNNVLGVIKNRVLVSVPIYISIAATLFVFIGSASVFDAEYDLENSNIRTSEDAIWWAVVTMFTVGYGDKFPISTEGRIYAVGLMLVGITIVGTITATFAGWLISQLREVESENQKILAKIEEINSKLS